jgi:hypothetical protein
MKFDKEFKDAISELTSSEKDKLILRLLKHDRILALRLQFELLGVETVEERRTEMETTVREQVKRMHAHFRNVAQLSTDIRHLSGRITEHVKVTSDKFGDVSLNLLMLNDVLSLLAGQLEKARIDKAQKLGMYIVTRTFKLLGLIKALHEDYFLEFREDLETLGSHIRNSPTLARISRQNGFDVNWLLEGDIPDDVKDLQARLRKQGYLK